ncbi:MAG: hypothetical protein RL701_7259, partial [Pseudomonadota bacterium]
LLLLVVLGGASSACEKACPAGTVERAGSCVSTLVSANMNREGPADASVGSTTVLSADAAQGATGGRPTVPLGSGGMGLPGTGNAAGVSSTAGIGAFGAGSSASNTPASLDLTCLESGKLRCSSSTPQAREACVAGKWAPYAACPTSQVCAGPDTVQPGQCLALAEVCRSRPRMRTCDGSGMLYECGPDGDVVGTPSRCGSADLCMAGLPTGVCATCLPGSFMCSGASLLICSTDGSGLVAKDSCASAELCDAQAGTCKTAVCEVGQRTCMGRDLYACNSTQTAYQKQSACPSGCSSQRSECNACDPSSAPRCSGDTTLIACQADGSGEESMICPKACSEGRCVDCVSPSQCTSNDPCRPSQCDLGSHKCTMDLAPRKTPCGGSRVCNALGSCVGCVDDSDCTDPKMGCRVDSTCQLRPGMESLQVTSSRSTVKLNPGYGLRAEIRMNGQGDNPVTITVGGQTSTLNKNNPSFQFSSATSARTVTITSKEHKESATCDSRARLDLSGSTATIYLEDIDGSGADCLDPVVTLTAL